MKCSLRQLFVDRTAVHSISEFSTCTKLMSDMCFLSICASKAVTQIMPKHMSHSSTLFGHANFIVFGGKAYNWVAVAVAMVGSHTSMFTNSLLQNHTIFLQDQF